MRGQLPLPILNQKLIAVISDLTSFIVDNRIFLFAKMYVLIYGPITKFMIFYFYINTFCILVYFL